MTLSTAADLSIILLAIEAFVVAVALGALLFFAARGMRMGNKWLRRIGFPEAQRYARLMSSQTQTYSNKITQPIVSAETATHRVRKTVSAIPRTIAQRVAQRPSPASRRSRR